MGERIGIFGGSGFYSLLDEVVELTIDTPFGPPSGPLALGAFDSPEGTTCEVAFLPRHGFAHELPAHRVNYRANLWAMHEIGVRSVIAPFACGSLQPGIRPGDLVVCDQLVDRTTRRDNTFFEGPVVYHAPFADPYCPHIAPRAIDAGRRNGFTVHEQGTVVVIDGPRFSSRAESQHYRAAGWDVINMTQSPEAGLARELGLCYAGVAYVTDHDSGVDGVEPVTEEQVYAAFAAALPRLQSLVLDVAATIGRDRLCRCHTGRGPVESLIAHLAS